MERKVSSLCTQPEGRSKLKVTVLGAGSYGTAIAYVATHNGHSVKIFCRSEEQATGINERHVNIKRMSDTILPDAITATTNFEKAVEGASLIMHCIPAQHTPEFIKKYHKLLPSGVPYVSTSKGVHVGNHELMSECIPKAMCGRADEGIERAEVPLAYLSGPSFAKEMLASHPMSVVVASYDSWAAKRVQCILGSTYFRVYTTDDVVGVEVGGALKNPLAIAAGIARGLGYGDSTIASLVTRGCNEMTALSVALGGRPETLAGLSGSGDLMLTCFSRLSRNNRFGEAIAKGMTPEEACEEIGEVVEGYPTSNEIMHIAKGKNLKLPIFYMVNKILNEKLPAKETVLHMMGKPASHERFVG